MLAEVCLPTLTGRKVIVKRRETAKARLKALLKREPNPFRIVGESYWADPKNWAEAAVVALNDENLDEPTRLAFEAFKLDPLSPSDWRLLLGALASIHFGVPKGKAGKPKIWRDSDLCELLACFYQVAARNTEHRKSDLCRFMARDRSFSDRNWFNKSSETVSATSTARLAQDTINISNSSRKYRKDKYRQVRRPQKEMAAPGRSATSFWRSRQRVNFSFPPLKG
jgi:hypothetical protein